jgi:transposase
MWVYVGDDGYPYNVFDFTLNRGRDGPKYFLKDYRQVLLADAYGGYNGVVAGNEITRAGCWAHMKRKVIDAEKAAPEIAREAVERVRALYAVERQCKDASVEERLELRQQQSAPCWPSCARRLLAWKEQLLPKHPMAEAVNYALGQWAELNVFCSDGAVSIDNNVSEREMKRVVLNRKNSLFVGNPRGGRTAAILASLTSTCRRHDIDPQLYLTQLLTNLSQVRKSELPTGRVHELEGSGMTGAPHKTAELPHCGKYNPERRGNRDVAQHLPQVYPASAYDVAQPGCAWDQTTKPDVHGHRPLRGYYE